MKKQWLPISIVILIIIGGIYFLHTKGIRFNTPASQQTSMISQSPMSSANALKNTLLTGKTQKCTIQDANGNSQTYYMDGVTVRTDIVTSSKKTVHLFSDGESVYIWAGTDKIGSSVPELETHTINALVKADGVAGFDITAKRDWQCTPWIADQSILGAPYTVVFTPVGK